MWGEHWIHLKQEQQGPEELQPTKQWKFQEKGKMIVTTKDQLLRTTTEVLEGEPTEISIPNIRRTPNLPNGMHNSKPTVLMVGQY